MFCHISKCDFFEKSHLFLGYMAQNMLTFAYIFSRGY